MLDAVRSKRMTWRAAAAALGIAPEQLLELARMHEIPIVRYDAEDLQQDLSTLTKIERERNTRT